MCTVIQQQVENMHENFNKNKMMEAGLGNNSFKSAIIEVILIAQCFTSARKEKNNNSVPVF